MDGEAKSTIAALFYADPDRIAFPDLVSELASSLLQNVDGGLDIHTAYDDFVMFDLADRRICLAYSDLAADFPEAARHHVSATAVIVSVGDRPDMPGGDDYAALCECLTDRIEARAPADGAVLAETDVAFTEEAFDAALEDILSAYWAETEHPPENAPTEPAPAEPIDPGTLASEPIELPDEVVEALFAPSQVYGTTSEDREAAPLPDITRGEDGRPKLVAPPAPKAPRKTRATTFAEFEPQALANGLAARFDRELARRSVMRAVPREPVQAMRSPGPTLYPSTTFGEPRPMAPPRNTRATATFARLRQQARPEATDDRLFPPTEEARAKPLVHRAAIHSVNLATLAFSLPMGAFLLTLALLGRESLLMSSRVTAITGAGIGIAQNDSVAAFVTGILS